MELINNKVKFIGTSNTNQDSPITIDYVPPLGDGQGYLGLELLVMSFAGCVSTTVVALLRRMGKTIDGYRIKATGIKKESPLSLDSIDFDVIVNSTDITYDDLQQVIARAEVISPVWIAIKNNVNITSKSKIES